MNLRVGDTVMFGPPGKPLVRGKVLRVGEKTLVRQLSSGHGQPAGTEWNVPRSYLSPEKAQKPKRAPPKRAPPKRAPPKRAPPKRRASSPRGEPSRAALLAAFRKIRIEGKSMARVTEETPIGSLGLDSIDLLDMVTHVEKISGATLPDTVLSKVGTVGDLLDAAVERRRSRR